MEEPKMAIVTGDTSGIGKNISAMLRRKHWQVIGQSKSTGFDIESPKDRARIVETSLSCDAFINNAQSGFGQTELLFELHERWLKKRQSGTIINICSMTALDHRLLHSKPKIYDFQKISLRELSLTLAWDSPFKVVCVNPNYVNTKRVLENPSLSERTKLEVGDISSVIEWILDQPQHICVSEISLKAHPIFSSLNKGARE